MVMTWARYETVSAFKVPETDAPCERYAYSG